MRYWTMSLAAILFLCAVADSQPGKKIDPGKKKDLGKKTDVGKAAETPPAKPMIVTEVQGRSFREWQKDIKDKDPTRRELALKAILQFDAEKAYEAVPDILAELKGHTPPKRIDLSTCVAGTTALVTIFKSTKAPDPKDAKAAVAIFRTFLKDEQLMLRIQAAQGLPVFGMMCQAALPEVITLAKEPSTWEARKEAVQILGMIGYDFGKDKFGKDRMTPKIYVMSEVYKALDDSAASVRIAAIRSSAALARNGTVDQKTQVYGKFKKAIDRDPDKHVVLAAHTAYIMLEGKASAAHLNPMRKMLKDENPEMRLDALQNIGALGKEASGAIPDLANCTDDPEASIAANAVLVLATIDPEGSRPLLTRIQASTKHPDAVRAAAKEVLAFQEKMAKQKKNTAK